MVGEAATHVRGWRGSGLDGNAKPLVAGFD